MTADHNARRPRTAREPFHIGVLTLLGLLLLAFTVWAGVALVRGYPLTPFARPAPAPAPDIRLWRQVVCTPSPPALMEGAEAVTIRHKGVADTGDALLVVNNQPRPVLTRRLIAGDWASVARHAPLRWALYAEQNAVDSADVLLAAWQYSCSDQSDPF